ncbi:MAG: hypothetical protein Q9219_001390 [cf. Caloplaca sp. 3 TL-2023]
MAVATAELPSSKLGVPSEALSNCMGDTGKGELGIKGDYSSAARRWIDAQHHGNGQQANGVHPFFDFEAQGGSVSSFQPNYPPLPDADLTPGWNSLAPQMPSPPHSATSPPSSWPSFGYQRGPPVHNILTDIYPDTRVQYGQNTPPDEDFKNVFAATEQTPTQINLRDPPLSASEKKRKRQPASSDSKTFPPKRSRKYGRSVDRSNVQVPSGAEDARRSKFLERNRIAASKCRQKKKEWTQNLESRARELQKENQSLRMMLDSLRDEIIFLKGEMLKHVTCGCEQIQGWVKTSAESLSESPVIKMEHSPINSAPSSRRGSVSSLDSGSHRDGPTSPAQEPSRRSKSPTLLNIEGLLINQLVHDTSNQGSRKTLQAAG